MKSSKYFKCKGSTSRTSPGNTELSSSLRSSNNTRLPAKDERVDDSHDDIGVIFDYCSLWQKGSGEQDQRCAVQHFQFGQGLGEKENRRAVYHRVQIVIFLTKIRWRGKGKQQRKVSDAVAAVA